MDSAHAPEPARKRHRAPRAGDSAGARGPPGSGRRAAEVRRTGAPSRPRPRRSGRSAGSWPSRLRRLGAPSFQPRARRERRGRRRIRRGPTPRADQAQLAPVLDPATARAPTSRSIGGSSRRPQHATGVANYWNSWMRLPACRDENATEIEHQKGQRSMTESITTNRREAVARQYVADVFTGGNAERARDYFTADIVWHGGALGTVEGVDNIVPVLGGFIGALSDIQASVQDAITSDDLVALRLVVTARPTRAICSGSRRPDAPFGGERRRHLPDHGRRTDQRAVGLRGPGRDPQPGRRDRPAVGRLTGTPPRPHVRANVLPEHRSLI